MGRGSGMEIVKKISRKHYSQLQDIPSCLPRNNPTDKDNRGTLGCSRTQLLWSVLVGLNILSAGCIGGTQGLGSGESWQQSTWASNISRAVGLCGQLHFQHQGQHQLQDLSWVNRAQCRYSIISGMKCLSDPQMQFFKSLQKTIDPPIPNN